MQRKGTATAFRTISGSPDQAKNGEISTKPIDLRGLLAALRMIRNGLRPEKAIEMGITNKCFDGFEREMIQDIVMTRIPVSWTSEDVF